MLLSTVVVRRSSRILLTIILMILCCEKQLTLLSLSHCPSETSSSAEAKTRSPEGSSISSEPDGKSFFYSLKWKQMVFELTK